MHKLARDNTCRPYPLKIHFENRKILYDHVSGNEGGGIMKTKKKSRVLNF